MRILVDTKALIWYLEGNESLLPKQRELIVNPRNEIFVSMATLWELAMKTTNGTLKVSRSLTEILKQLTLQSIEILNIQPGHVLQLATLPPDVSDPFDRMIVAQSQVEFLPVITTDEKFAHYGVRIL